MSTDKTRQEHLGDKTIADAPPPGSDKTAGYAAPEARSKPTFPDPLDLLEAEEEPQSNAPTAADSEDAAELQARILKRMAASGARVRKDPFIGSIINDKYEVTAKVGTGGMGVVYKARQKGMDRNVAIKVLLKEYLTNDKAVKRFQREALAVSRLEHPNTIRIFDFGEAEAGTLFIAMEFLSGQPLANALASDIHLPVRRTLRIVAQMCRSLDEAHRKGIIHRDLKPDNVFVGEVDGNTDYVKVLDFGVAKLAEGRDDRGTLTQHGVIFGTPKYMSPEQCRSQEVDARSDLYSVGVMMYEMLSGRVPFESDNSLAILIMHSQDPPAPMAEVRPDLVIPFEVEALLHKLLAKEVADRPQSAREVAEACDDLLLRIPEEFEKVLTYDDAAKTGLQIDRSHAYTVPDRALTATIRARLAVRDEMDRATIAIEAPALPMSRRRKVAIGFGVVALLLAGTAAGVWSQLRPLPDTARVVIPSTWAMAELPALEPDLVAVTLEANVGNVTLIDKATGVVVGAISEANKPTRFDWLREPGRKVTLVLEHGASKSHEVLLELGQSQAPAKVMFEANTAPEIPMVKLVVKGPPGALVQVEGEDAAYPIGEDGAERTISLVKADASRKVTVSKAGFLPKTEDFQAITDGRIEVVLEPDPAATAKPPEEVVIAIRLPVGKVRVKVGSSGAMFETPATTEAPFELRFPRGEGQETLSFERAGYEPATKTVELAASSEVTVELVKRTVRVNPQAQDKPPTDPGRLTPVKDVQKKPETPSKLGPLKGF